MKYSVIIPLFNEEPNILPLFSEVEEVMESLEESWELLAIDDGSTDGTANILQRLAKTKSFVHPVSFDGNYGQSSAFAAGFRIARGEILITLDGDGQNDPQDIPRLLHALRECDMVCGERRERKDSFVKRWISRWANRIRQRVCGDGITDTGCSLKVYRRKCLETIKLFHGMHRFLPALVLHEGFRVRQIPVNHRPRVAGKSKYSLWNRSFNTIADMFAVRWMGKRRLCYRMRQG